MQNKSYLLKIRGGVEVDSAGKKAGKGPLIAEEISHTLGTSQDQYLFQAVEEKSKAIGFMRGLGGVQTMNEKMPTLQAANGMSGNNKPCVCSAGFKPNQGAKAKGVGYEKEKCPTLLAGQEPAVCISFEPGIASRDGGHVYEGVSGTLRAMPGDNQMTVAYDIGEARLRTPQEYIEKSPTITARCGTGGNNVPAVVFENHAQDSRYKGPLKVAQPVTATYGMGGNNQPLVICLQGNGIDRADTAGCNGKGWTEDVSYTLNTIDRHAVACCMETFHCNTEEEKKPPIKARDYKDPLVICYEKTKK